MSGTHWGKHYVYVIIIKIAWTHGCWYCEGSPGGWMLFSLLKKLYLHMFGFYVNQKWLKVHRYAQWSTKDRCLSFTKSVTPQLLSNCNSPKPHWWCKTTQVQNRYWKCRGNRGLKKSAPALVGLTEQHYWQAPGRQLVKPKSMSRYSKWPWEVLKSFPILSSAPNCIMKLCHCEWV